MSLYENLLDKATKLSKMIDNNLETDLDLLLGYQGIDEKFIEFIVVQESIGDSVVEKYEMVSKPLRKVRKYFKNKYDFDIETFDNVQYEKYIKILKRELRLNNLTDDN